MKNNKYSVIVSDLGNVLIPFHYDIMIGNFNKIEPGLGNKFIGAYKNHYHEIHRSFERGDLTEDKFINQVLSFLGNKIDAETFCKYYSEIFTVNEDVVNLLPKLKKNYRLVLLSNTNSIHRKYGWQKYKFLEIFEKLILSYEVNAVKPEEKIYRAIEDYTKEPAEKHIFIDDVFEYAEGAKKVGWDAIQFISYKNLIEEFDKRNIIY
jgi:glucose-1-phosphatase